jgi:RimJ/RimL family protein N-acetyltransferase
MTNASATKDFVCRPLERDEWQSFKAIRLEALQKEPGVFGGILDIEKNQPQDYWEDWVHSGKTRCFGLFHGDAMIGCTGIVTDRTDATGTTALLIASYIQEAHRGRGLSGLLYKARLAYAANHPDWTRVIVSHRRSNEQSRRANQNHGFVHTHDEPKTWPDGMTEDNVFYTLDITDRKTRPHPAVAIKKTLTT